MKRCDQDEHFYDEDQYSECPYCRKTGRKFNESNEKGSSGERDPHEPTRRGIRGEKNGSKQSAQGVTKRFYGSETGSTQMPTVGWVVVVKGPGTGHDLSIKPGQNSLGRDSTMDICIDFGDESISRKEHAFIIYDPKNNAYYIKHGGSQNLTYLNGAMVMDPKQLAAHDCILVGQTELLFVPLCADGFNWDPEK
jgi:FHA domain